MNRFAALPLLLASTLLAAQPAPPSSPPAPPATPSPPFTAGSACEVLEQNGEAQSVSCAIAGAGTAQRYRFQVNFGGGHDDTMASMEPTIAGRPVACENGGKLRLMGEDGDVSLDCTFVLDAAAGSRQALDVRFRWSHAQYQNFELTHLSASRTTMSNPVATGTFKVKLQPLAFEGQPEGSKLGRMSIDKDITGDLVATTQGQMLSAMGEVKGSAGYVAIETVQGTLHGRRGSFVLQHSGTLNRGEAGLQVTVVPDSGTGDLVGLAGDFRIIVADGVHRYEFAYTLP